MHASETASSGCCKIILSTTPLVSKEAFPATPQAVCEWRNDQANPGRSTPDRLFDPNPARRSAARSPLYEEVEDLPIVGPHGHVPPKLLADPGATLGTPAELFVIPDHYVFRMLYSQGVPLEDLGVPTSDGTPFETDHRRSGSASPSASTCSAGPRPASGWPDELVKVFGVTSGSPPRAPSGSTTGSKSLASPSSRLARSLERFNLESCAPRTPRPTRSSTTQRCGGGPGRGCGPTFRPDSVVNLARRAGAHVERLAQGSGIDVVDYGSFVGALEDRRAFFKEVGAVATDHSASTPHAERLDGGEAGAIFARALSGRPTPPEDGAGSPPTC